MSDIVRYHNCMFKVQKMMKIVLCLAFITSIVHGGDKNSICGDPDWIAFDDDKCVKLFKSFETRHQAEEVCNQQDSTLISIKSAVEQKFLIKNFFNTPNAKTVWIGAERRLDGSSEFYWSDGTPVQRFTNWAFGHPSNDVSRPCVLMKSSLSLSTELSEVEWVDVSCTSEHWFICQKGQTWSNERLQEAIMSIYRELQYVVNSFSNQITEMNNDVTTQLNGLREEITDIRNTVAAQATQLESNTNLITDTRSNVTIQAIQIQALQANPVPIGFIYVQLPNQPEPGTIWTTVGWVEVTSEYAGLFFRAQGGGSAEFGATQTESSPRLVEVKRVLFPSKVWANVYVYANNIPSDSLQIGPVYLESWGLTFTVSAAEVRPRNKAMRIWKRI